MVKFFLDLLASILNPRISAAKAESILKMAKEAFPEVAEVEIGRMILTQRHCGRQMVQIRMYYQEQECPNHFKKWRGPNEYFCACESCSYHFTNLPAMGVH